MRVVIRIRGKEAFRRTRFPSVWKFEADHKTGIFDGFILQINEPECEESTRSRNCDSVASYFWPRSRRVLGLKSGAPDTPSRGRSAQKPGEEQ
jgi:hypothetical protein